jgi:general secretion pathway protein C
MWADLPTLRCQSKHCAVSMSKATHGKNRSRAMVWSMRAVNMLGAMGVTLAIMWQAGMMSQSWWDRFTAPKPIPVAKAPSRTSTKAIGIAPPVPKGNDSSISPVALKLLLIRVHPGRNVAEGSADIGVARESPQTYQAGAILENGSRLAEIHPDYVLLLKDGRDAKLYLDGASKMDKKRDTAMLMVGGPTEAPPPAKVTSREILTDYIRPTPVYEGEHLVGYQVYAGSKAMPFTQMGLQPGDVIVEVNDTPLADPASAWDKLRQLTDGSVLSTVVKRHGALVHVDLDGMLIARAEEARQQQIQVMLVPERP